MKQKSILTYNTSKKKISWLNCFICYSNEKEAGDFTYWLHGLQKTLKIYISKYKSA